MSKKLTWLTHKNLSESFFVDLIVNDQKDQNCNDKNLKDLWLKF
jgi:hypothetical protein